MNNFLSSVSFSLSLTSPLPPPQSSVLSVQEKNKDKDKDKRFRPLYDIPYMFEAREFLRKKLIGKKVSPADVRKSPKTDVFWLQNGAAVMHPPKPAAFASTC